MFNVNKVLNLFADAKDGVSFDGGDCVIVIVWNYQRIFNKARFFTIDGIICKKHGRKSLKDEWKQRVKWFSPNCK